MAHKRHRSAQDAAAGPAQSPMNRLENRFWGGGEAGKKAGGGVKQGPANGVALNQMVDHGLGGSRASVDSEQSSGRLELAAERLRSDFGGAIQEDHVVGAAGRPTG